MKRPDNLHEPHFDEMIIGGAVKEPLQNVSKDMCRESEANDISTKFPCPAAVTILFLSTKAKLSRISALSVFGKMMFSQRVTMSRAMRIAE